RGQEPDQHHHREDRGAGAIQEHLGAVEHADRDAAQPRHLVVGQLQHERRRRMVAPQEEFRDRRDRQRAGDAGGIEAEHHEPLQIDEPPERGRRNEGRDDQRVDRNSRRTGHQRRDQDRGQAVAAVVDHPRRHDAGNGAGEARQQRNEGPAMQPGAAHDAVHQERGARHIAEIFQQQDEQEDDDDLRQEHDDAADARDQAVLQEALQQAPARGQQVVDQLPERGKAVRQQLHRRLRPGEH
ncbi:hypothetical protein chiPu_0030690, partial [Chiloscyllium punctatum]|nr:hypothetical protein [Chiloscyllium punctatum]